MLINFDNGVWFSIFITDEDDIIYYDYRDELIDAIKNKFGFHIEDPDIKKEFKRLYTIGNNNYIDRRKRMQR